MRIRTILPALGLFLSLTAFADENKSDRNVMLNAEEASVPRELNTGLTPSGTGAVVSLNGMKHTDGIPSRSQYHWSGGNAYEPIKPINLIESIVRFGEVSIMMDSRTRLGGEKLSGAFTGATSSNGLIRFDGALNGPINKAKGWYFSVGAYLNLDPTNVNSPSRTYIDNKQIFLASLSKRWKASSLDFIYSISFNRDAVGAYYGQAPFIYNGDGSISALDGFRIGRDSYMPVDERVSFLDLKTGKMQNKSLKDFDLRRIHDFTVQFKHKTENDWKLTAQSHICYMPLGNTNNITLNGVDKVDALQGYSTEDGAAYSGNIQKRLVLANESYNFSVGFQFMAERKFEKHRILAGFMPAFAHQSESSSSYLFAHTVEANPVRIYKNGVSTWDFNKNATYYNAFNTSFSTFVYDDWTPDKRWLVRTGLRFAPIHQLINCYNEQKGSDVNKRVEGFNLADPSLALNTFRNRWNMNFAVSEHVSYRIKGRLFAMAEGLFSGNGKSPAYFKNQRIPSLLPIYNLFGRGGLMYDNKWMDVTLMFSYITNFNSAKMIQVSKKIAGQTETQPYTAQMGVKTPGITIDGNLYKGGFKLHVNATWQDPRYKNYRCEFNFSDGSQEIIDYTGKHVTGISKWMIEFDPSYQWKQVRLWTSIRYNSRQYASRTNLAYFDGHFETFAGADMKVDKHSAISLNVINVLGQTGAKGSIDAVDTVTDPAELQGILIAGTYIRPLSIELKYTYRF